MPSRLIRESLLDSERYWSVTIEARQMYLHMLLLADDFGCISVSPTFLRRRCFNDSPSHERIAKLLNELNDADLIRLYDHDRACFAFIPRFRQRLQRNTLKHPTPPDWALEGDEHAKQLFNGIKNKSINPTVGQRLETRSPSVPQPPEVKRREEKEVHRARFAPPSLEEVTAFVKESGSTVDPVTFIDYYTSNGWKVGKNPMKDWKATVRRWSRTSDKPETSVPYI
jgi:hypothetical protein